MIAALFVDEKGPYSQLGGIDAWGIDKDAKKYNGPHPVIAHPPCQRWGKMWAGSPSWIKKTGQRKKKGDDGGCFESALNSVRKYGGIIEHPMHSHACFIRDIFRAFHGELMLPVEGDVPLSSSSRKEVVTATYDSTSGRLEYKGVEWERVGKKVRNSIRFEGEVDA